MQIALSIRGGRLSSTLLLRRLGTESRKTNIYKAFRELGRVIRTITLLRFVSEPGLRQRSPPRPTRPAASNRFSAWLRFGHDAIERNDPAEQEKIIKFNTVAGQLRDLPHRTGHDRRPARAPRACPPGNHARVQPADPARRDRRARKLDVDH